MLTNQNIIDELSRLIAAKYPEYPVYMNGLKDDLQVPSFFIEYIMDTTENVNINITNEKLYLNVTYLGNKDEQGMTDSTEKQEVLNNLKSIFRQGYIQVQDRAVSLTCKAKAIANNVGLELEFNYFEQRNDDSANEELIQEISINQDIRR